MRNESLGPRAGGVGGRCGAVTNLRGGGGVGGLCGLVLCGSGLAFWWVSVAGSGRGVVLGNPIVSVTPGTLLNDLCNNILDLCRSVCPRLTNFYVPRCTAFVFAVGPFEPQMDGV